MLVRMSEGPLVYKVQDRSVLLPYFKRFLINPFLPFLPQRLNPNTITHAGHLLNLCAAALLLVTGRTQGWPLVAAVVLLNLYNWCDNADGAHARRTGQTSALGEFLDHGLDMLNTIYISCMSAVAIGAPPLTWLAIGLILPAAAASTYWEQAETGMFHLGTLNQIESVVALSSILLISAVVGNEWWAAHHVGPLTLQWAVLIFVLGVATFGMLHGMYRVVRTGAKNLVPIAPLHLFNGTVAAAACVGAMTPVAAILVGTSGNVFFGLRMLAVRLSKRRPGVEAWLVLGAIAVGCLIVWRLSGHPVGQASDVTYSAVACVIFGGLALLNAREGVRRVLVIDREAATIGK
jgi:phosphatidylglycerophosphate synthase